MSMVCPLCKTEYTPEFTRCGRCDTELVDASPGRSGEYGPDGNLVLLWSGDDLALHASLLEELRAAGVAYFNRPISNYSLRAFPNRFPISAPPAFGFEVSVLSSDSEKANAILRRFQDSAESGSEKG